MLSHEEEIVLIKEDIRWVNSQRRYNARTHTLDVLKRELARLQEQAPEGEDHD